MKTCSNACVAACLLLALLSLAVPVAAMETITGPVVITEPGVYRLGNDIVNSGAPVCIDIRTGGVTIDGRGYLIDGIGTPGSVGIRVQLTGSASPDTVIRNVRLTDWSSGVQLYKAVRPTVRSCSFSGNRMGIEAYCTDDAVITSCAFYGNGDGVALDGSTDAVVRASSFSTNTYGISLGLTLRCIGVSVLSNEIDGSTDTGIILGTDTQQVTIRNNRITNSGTAGLSLNEAAGHVVKNNVIPGTP